LEAASERAPAAFGACYGAASRHRGL
jgi:hypothetical protein